MASLEMRELRRGAVKTCQTTHLEGAAAEIWDFRRYALDYSMTLLSNHRVREGLGLSVAKQHSQGHGQPAV